VSILFLSLSVHLIGQEGNGKAMESFMGAKWGISAAEFESTFWYKDQLKKKDYDFYLKDFKLGNLVIGEIKFIFRGKGDEKIKLQRRNYERVFLIETYIFIKPEQFDGLLEIFKIKYGDPQKYTEHPVRNRSGDAFMQKIAEWINTDIKRMIIVERQASKLVDGVAMLIPYRTKVIKEKKDLKKAAAEKI